MYTNHMCIIFIAVILTACISSPNLDSPHRDQNAKDNVLTDKIIISYPWSGKKIKKPWYVELSKKSGDKWQLVSIKKKRNKTLPAEHEQFQVSKNLKLVRPTYSKQNISASRTTFVCSKGGYMSKYHLSEPYNGCNSRLVTSLFTLEKLWGKEVVVKLDPEKVYDLFRETNTLDEIRKCDALRKEISAFRKKIDISMQVIDESGLHNGEPVARHSISIKSFSCPGEINSLRYHVVVYPSNKSPYIIDIHPKRFELQHDDSEYKVTSKITIKAKKHHELFIKDIYENHDIGIELIRTIYRVGDIIFYYALHNRSNKYITVSSVSLYVGKEIFTDTFSRPRKLPPHSSTQSENLIIKPTRNNFIEVKNLLTPTLTRHKAETTFLELGASVHYDINGKSDTLLVKKQYKYIKLL